MVSEENKVAEEEVSLSEYLEPDTREILEIKSLYNMEYEYSQWLGTIEYAIANYYINNRKLQDKNVILALKNIKKNYEKDISFFKSELEKAIVEDLLEVLEESPLTHHEFKLALEYVLWAIDNRSWMEDKQAYVKWIAYVFGFFSEEEKDKYEKQFKRQTSKMGIPDAQVETLLMKRDDEDFFDEKAFFEEEGLFEGLEASKLLEKESVAEDLETGFFLMTDEEKFNFLLEHGPDYVELVKSYILELAENLEFKKIKDFYNKLSEKHPDFMYLHFLMGVLHTPIDPALAKSCFEKTLETAEKDETVPETILESLRLKISELEEYLSNEIEEAKDKN